jgi:hypothetical protein
MYIPLQKKWSGAGLAKLRPLPRFWRLWRQIIPFQIKFTSLWLLASFHEDCLMINKQTSNKIKLNSCQRSNNLTCIKSMTLYIYCVFPVFLTSEKNYKPSFFKTLFFEKSNLTRWNSPIIDKRKHLYICPCALYLPEYENHGVKIKRTTMTL